MKRNSFLKTAAVLSMLVLALVITGVPGIALATVTGVSITPGSGQSYTIPVGGTVDLTASMTQTGTTGTPAYSWAHGSGITLSADTGDTTQVTGITPGTYSVTLTGTNDADSTSATASINITVTAMTISNPTLSLVGGATYTLTVGNVLSGSVSWESNNTNVATVDSNGLVNAVGAGSATITVKSTPSSGIEQTKTCAVTVTPVISISPASQTITAASTTGSPIVLTIQYGGDLITSASTVTWSSSNGSLGTLSGTSALTGSSTLSTSANFTSSTSAVNGTTTISARINGAGTYTNTQTATVTVRTSQYLDITGPSTLNKTSRTGDFTVYLRNADGTIVDNDSSTVHWSWSSSYLSLTSDDLNDRRADMHDGEAHIQLYGRYNTPSAGTRLYVWLDSNEGNKIYHTITISGLSSLPQTGQDMTFVYIFGGLGAALLVATGVMYGIRKKRTVA